MGYKVGDEVLVKARIIEDCIGICGLKTQEGIVFNAKKENLLPIPDMTAEEAWDIARKIVILENEGGIPAKDMVHMFGVKFPRDIVREYSVHEVKAKIEAWEVANEIKVGDEVALKADPDKDDSKFFVTKLDKKEKRITGFSGFDGGVFRGRDITKYQKTGRHINIEGLLKQIGGDE